MENEPPGLEVRTARCERAALESSPMPDGADDTARPAAPQRVRAMDLRSKRAAVLRTLLERGQRGLSCFEAVNEAARELRDHVLPTTASQLEDRGIRIERAEETVQGAFGPVHCCRYWLAPAALQCARQLLGYAKATSGNARDNTLTLAR